MKKNNIVEYCKNDSIKIQEIQDIILSYGYDCVNIFENDTAGSEDSIIILGRKGILSSEQLIFDYSKLNRELKVWNYPKASDVLVKIGPRLYKRTLGYD